MCHTHRFIVAFPDPISDRGKNKKVRLFLGRSKGHLSHQVSSLNSMPVPSKEICNCSSIISVFYFSNVTEQLCYSFYEFLQERVPSSLWKNLKSNPNKRRLLTCIICHWNIWQMHKMQTVKTTYVRWHATIACDVSLAAQGKVQVTY